MKSSPTSRNSMPRCSGAVSLWLVVRASTEMGRVQMAMRAMLARGRLHVGRIRDRHAGRGAAVQQRVEQDRAEGRGAYATQREGAELEREVASAQHQGDGRDDQVLVLREVHAV